MSRNFSGREYLEFLVAALRKPLDQGLEALFGTGVHHPAVAGISWADLAVVCCLLLLIGAAHLAVARLLRRLSGPGVISSYPQPAAWRAPLAHAAGKPLYVLVWLAGVYVAVTPLLPAMAVGVGNTPHPVRVVLEGLFDLAVFAVFIWFVFRLTHVAEALLKEWAQRTSSKLDDVLAPLVGRTLRVVVPVVGIILALPLVGLSADTEGVLAKMVSILLIGTVAWVLFQGVATGERAVLAKYDVKAADNLEARKVYTQVHVLSKTIYFVISLFTVASVLMLFEEVRRFGTSLLASAGVIGIVVGFAAQRTIANLFAGFQLALTQPIRLDDVVIVENEWGRVEEITLTYVVIRIWDERRLVVPLSHFIEKPFQNWTRVSADLLGSVTIWVDYSLPLDQVRQAVKSMVESHPLWDRRFWNVQVTDATDRAMQIRVLATAADSGKAWDLRCDIREQLIGFVQRHCATSLPRLRAEVPVFAYARTAKPAEPAASGAQI